jgi:hypothetical protein
MDLCFDWPNAWVNHTLIYMCVCARAHIILWLCLKCFIFVAMIHWGWFINKLSMFQIRICATHS